MTSTIPLTMSSLEIAGLTGKIHKNVLHDIRDMLKTLDIPELKFERCYRGDDGKDHPMFDLPKRETLILVSGYSVEMRSRIVDRWMELEAAICSIEAIVAKVLGDTVSKMIEAKFAATAGAFAPGLTANDGSWALTCAEFLAFETTNKPSKSSILMS